MKPQPGRNFGSRRAFDHEGANAAPGFTDNVYGLGFGYVPARAKRAAPAGVPPLLRGRPADHGSFEWRPLLQFE